jgi:hypothetical protein
VRQYDICENLNQRSRKLIPFFVVLQSDTLSDLRTVIVAPMVAKDARVHMERLYPAISIKKKVYMASMAELASIDSRRLGKAVGNCAESHTAFVSAVDLLFLGY